MKLDTSSQSNEQRKTETAKKIYYSPKLAVYGNIAAITRSVDMVGADDGAPHGNDKT